jgi:hypothetical protein
MRLKRIHFALATLVLSTLVSGCEPPKSKTATDLSTDQRGSALRVPEASLAVAMRVRNGEAESKATFGTLPALADKLSETDYEVVLDVVDAAEDAGEDPGYGLAAREMATTSAFFEQEREPLTKKVGGMVQYTASQQCGGGKVDTWGAVSTGLKDGVKERIDERMESSNDAFLLIDRHQDAIGKKNVETVETIAREVAKASYVVHVAMEGAEEDLLAAKSAAEDAKSSIEKLISEENEPPKSTSKPSAEAEKSKKERIANAQEKLKIADDAIAQTTKELENLEQRKKDLTSAYDAAISDLKGRLAAKKK